MILQAPEPIEKAGAAASAQLVGYFVALCVVILLTRVGSQVLLSRLTQTSTSRCGWGSAAASSNRR